MAGEADRRAVDMTPVIYVIEERDLEHYLSSILPTGHGDMPAIPPRHSGLTTTVKLAKVKQFSKVDQVHNRMA